MFFKGLSFKYPKKIPFYKKPALFNSKYLLTVLVDKCSGADLIASFLLLQLIIFSNTKLH